MHLNEMKQALAKLQRELQAYNHALACLQTDGETAAPEAASKARGETMAFFSQKSYELLVSQETRDLLSDLWACRDELDALTRRQVELLRKQQADMTCIPMESCAMIPPPPGCRPRPTTITPPSSPIWPKSSKPSAVLPLIRTPTVPPITCFWTIMKRA